MSTPNLDFLEMAHNAGFRAVVCDVEHNAFSPDRREALVVAAKALGMRIFFKIEAPEPVWVQRALDLAVDGVIIPHAGRLADLRAAVETAKFPPLGTRSYAAGRSARFQAPDEDYFARCNREILCLPMIETAEAFEDVEAILGHDCVDGIFVGPFDLALTRGRATYAFTEADRADITRLAEAAGASGKVWWMPTWRPEEQAFAHDKGVAMRVVAAEHQVIALGLSSLTAALKD
ncbi:MAG: hydroxyacid aldolase [Rhodobacteraceae bacterium]|nr:hydroxyacid aldolase [Paracoccaceae bacterium]MBR9822299.1 hydroxyacid aldolase [Paracoccaceae bacterium]